ncbi:type I polyketide synthase [Nannocystis punicea]|uniref:Aminotransferase class III-fold pyridoxal phosphate-dependent enzyme n=1 Tax=Nannocystis punicea TaxID=2995304 RepID=A0ABY7GX28_9BACT|nr:type I polyketide synthase [Nannocystis poenicansa]WAS91507.1 aminotransferase class III-fold pyridoxal phosphate-dependent enzyme [Nannocystis poenicansa]
MDLPVSSRSTLIDVLELRAERDPDLRVLTFVADDDGASESLTVSELATRARSVAAWLVSSGLAGQRIVLLFPQGLEFVVAYFGCLYAGAVAVPAPMPHPSRLARTLPRLRGMIADATPAAVLSNREGVAMAPQITAALGTEALRWLALEDAPPGLESAWRRPTTARDRPAHLQYTSGSTASPKGTIITHANILANSRAIRQSKRYSAESRGVVWVPHFHDDGLVHGLVQPLHTGYPCLLFPATAFVARPELWLRLISQAGGTHSGGPNFAYELCLRKVSDEQRERLDLSSWRFAYNAAEPVRLATLHRFHRRFAPQGFRWSSFAPCYGLAEATLTVSVGLRADGPRVVALDAAALAEQGVVRPVPKDTAGAQIFVGNGPPVADTEVAIVDPGTGLRCAADRVGEIFVRSACVAAGYLGRAEASAHTFEARIDATDGTYLRTGDQGFLLDGELFITGRLKDLIVIRGANRYPQDLEQSVERCHPAVAPGCVAAFSVEAGGEERLAIAAEIKGQPGTTAEALHRDALRAIVEVLSEEHDLRPYSIVLLAPGNLPKTSSGKIQRRAAAQTWTEDAFTPLARFTDSPATAPTSRAPQEHAAPQRRSAAEIEAFLTAYLASELGARAGELGPDVPFRRYGLDSAGSVRMAAELASFVAARVDPTLVWSYPSLRVLSRHLAGETVAAAPDPAAATAGSSGAVAIIGAACRFPGGVTDLDSFWRLLDGGIDAVEELPRARRDARHDSAAGEPPGARWGGFLRDIDRFDPAFFEVSPREAAELDPQIRLLLEVGWEALEQAGQTLQGLRGSDTGVFVGISGHEYERMAVARRGASDPHLFLGTAHSTGVARLSYWLGLQGPNVPVDTACSSSLVAVHLACQALRAGDCSMALAGGVSLMLGAEATAVMGQMGALSPTGRCRTFSADADGYVRGEGCGVVVLKRLADAERDGDPILAVIRGSAVNQDGRSNGLTAPNGLAQEAVIRRALANAAIDPGAVGFVEAHGTGTPLGDPIEVGALRAVFGAERPDGDRCVLGAVKTNLGHLEAAAGVAGLIKTVLALRHERLPANLHLREPNPHIDLAGSALAFAAAPLPFPRGARPRLAGVSSFGISGTNAHVIVEEAPPPRQAIAAAPQAVLLPLSAHDEQALRARASAWRQWLVARQDLPLGPLAHTASARRSHHEFRLGVVGANMNELAAALAAFAAGEAPAGATNGRATTNPPKVVFVFPGQGSQWCGMGQQLAEAEPVFGDALAACDAAIRAEAGFSVVEELRRPEESSRLGEIDVVQPVLFAVQVALAALWRSWGVEPAAVVGHSMGEVAAAYVAGALSLADAVAVICRRSRSLRVLRGRGAMALIELNLADAEAALRGREDRLSVAVSNGPRSTVIAGDPAALEAVLAELQRAGVFYRRVNVDVASHSPQMEPLRGELLATLADVSPRALRVPMCSTVTAAPIAGAELTAAYWADNLRRPVRFSEATRRMLADGHTVFVEISPHPIVLASVEENIIDAGVRGVALPSLRRTKDERQTMLLSLAALYVRGVEIAWPTLAPPAGPLAPLPAYPWQRKRYWIDAPAAGAEPAATTASQARGRIDMQQAHHEAIRAAVHALVSEVTGLAAADIHESASLIRMGIDSLMVMQLRNAIRARLQVDLPTPLFFEPTTTVASLIDLTASQVPPAAVEEVAEDEPEPVRSQDSGDPDDSPAVQGDVAGLMAAQLRALSDLTRRQLETLQRLGGRRERPTNPAKHPSPARPTPPPPRAPAAAATPGVFVPYKPIQRAATVADDGAILGELTREVCEPTATSKARTQADRLVFANNRNIAGFTPAMKEMTYQIIAERAAGSRIWDLDGNEYIDLTMSFGASLLGHDHPALTTAIEAQMEKTWAVGPISSVAGEVAQRLCQLTGHERAAFYNSGTEAVMVALRLARTATGRAKIAIFEGSYHGMADGVLALPRRGASVGAAAPMAPGVPESAVHDTLVLRFDDPAALEAIAAHRDELAAVLVEPVQSRRPDQQARGFLHALREVTRSAGIALIFDEVVTGLRTLPGGAQAWFGVQADLATYGKVVGGGMPVGVVAGSARFIDGVDGGMWSFGDDSYPARTNTFVAGTFCSHPLAMATSRALLELLGAEGPALHRRLNARTRGLCVQLNTVFADLGLPIHTVNFGSLFRFVMPRACELLYYKLLARGVYVWEGRNCFLSTAHSDADLDRVVEVVTEAAQWLARAVPERAVPGFGVVELPASSAQRAMFARCRRPGGDRAYHVPAAMRVRGALRPDGFEAAVTELVRRHPSLRTCFRSDGDALWQRVHPVGGFEVIHERIDASQIAAFVDRVTAPFDLATPALVRFGLGELGADDWVVVVDAHHLVVDGLSLDQLVDELFALHEGGAPPEPSAAYTDFVAWERTYLDSRKLEEDAAFWRAHLDPPPPRLELPADFPPEERRAFAGELVHFELAEPQRLRTFAREHGVTPQVLLGAGFRVLAWLLSGQSDVCFGGPTAGRPEARFFETVGLFIGAVVYRARVHADETFARILEEARAQSVRILDAQHYPFERLIDLLGPGAGAAPFEVGFSYEATPARGARQFGALDVEPIPTPPRGISMDVVLECVDDGDTFAMRFAFNPGRFRRETVEAWAAAYQRLLPALVAAPERPLGAVCDVAPLRDSRVTPPAGRDEPLPAWTGGTAR